MFRSWATSGRRRNEAMLGAARCSVCANLQIEDVHCQLVNARLSISTSPSPSSSPYLSEGLICRGLRYRRRSAPNRFYCRVLVLRRRRILEIGGVLRRSGDHSVWNLILAQHVSYNQVNWIRLLFQWPPIGLLSRFGAGFCLHGGEFLESRPSLSVNVQAGWFSLENFICSLSYEFSLGLFWDPLSHSRYCICFLQHFT